MCYFPNDSSINLFVIHCAFFLLKCCSKSYFDKAQHALDVEEGSLSNSTWRKSLNNNLAKIYADF